MFKFCKNQPFYILTNSQAGWILRNIVTFSRFIPLDKRDVLKKSSEIEHYLVI